MKPKGPEDNGPLDPVSQVCFTIVFTVLGAILILFFTGCTVLKIEQRDESPDARTITTTVKATAWFSSAQTLSKLKAITTDKTQSIGTDNLGQHGATNSVAALEAIARILEALRPTP